MFPPPHVANEVLFHNETLSLAPFLSSQEPMSLESVTDEAKEQRSAIEMATHIVLEQTLDVALEKNQNFDDSGAATLLDAAIWMSGQGYCELNLPFLLLEETFEAITISDCRHVFSFIETRADRLLEVEP